MEGLAKWVDQGTRKSEEKYKYVFGDRDRQIDRISRLKPPRLGSLK